jgi:glycerophosphoryl diester phosphodiesterase
MERLIGHRGAAGYAPENTIAAFDKAYALGCRFIEFDVMLSADGEAFVFHDEHLKRTTNGRGEFGLVTADYLRSLDAGSWYSKKFQGEKIPTLHDAIQWLTTFGVHANIEIKPYPGFTEQTTTAVLTQINRYWPQDKKLPLVSCFDLDALTLCRSLSPEMPLGLLLHTWQDNWLQLARDLNCYSVHLSRRAATAKRVAAIKAQGYVVYVYTVNWKYQAKKFINWGVDAVFSDYPGLLGIAK